MRASRYPGRELTEVESNDEEKENTFMLVHSAVYDSLQATRIRRRATAWLWSLVRLLENGRTRIRNWRLRARYLVRLDTITYAKSLQPLFNEIKSCIADGQALTSDQMSLQPQA